MKLLHVAKQAGISHDELSMSTTNMFGVGSLDALGAGVMAIDTFHRSLRAIIPSRVAAHSSSEKLFAGSKKAAAKR